MTKMFPVKFDEAGLIPAIVQEEGTGEVLMMAYMNSESLTRTIEAGRTYFWSRSRKELWEKGATSGNCQSVKEVWLDCDEDTLLIKVEQKGGACHTGRHSCFFNRISPSAGTVPSPNATHGSPEILRRVYAVIQDRREHPKEGSYVSSLFTAGQDTILKKISEEAGEAIIASKNREREEIIHELADLWFHTLVLLGEHQIPLEAIFEELERRFGK